MKKIVAKNYLEVRLAEKVKKERAAACTAFDD